MATKAKAKPKARAARRVPPVPAACDALLSMRQVLDALGGISRAKFKQMQAAGDFPPPDLELGEQSQRWRSSTLNRWFDERSNGGRSIEK